MIAVRIAAVVAALVVTVPQARADVLSDLADQCQAALAAGDDAAFQNAAYAIRKRQDVFNTEARKRAEDCLSRGYGEPWEYVFASSAWEPSAAFEARVKATEDARRAEAKAAADAEAAAAQAEADRRANAVRVASFVYAACTDLMARDIVAAMTNQTCVDSFLANGLPDVADPADIPQPGSAAP